MTTYIRDLFDLPDYVQRGDFVLRLTEGITKPEETVKNYVVTPQLAESFNAALNLIRSALAAHSSKAAYLHGSFGSGKSHFMAILNLILHGNQAARSIPELAHVIAKHNEWSADKKFLLVPYHFVDAKDMESALLGGYVNFVRKHHPTAAIPGVYLAENLFKDANNLRSTMGDAAFFQKLNQATDENPVSVGWGNIGAGWNADTFDNAAHAEPNSDERTRIVGDLIATYFSSAKGAGEFVDLDTGLSIISRHAKSLGYDVLILFLDELILWLGSRAADTNFLHREGQKLAKLVEAQSPDRPAPIVSFVARQRDLRDFVSDNVMGVQLASFTDVLKYWEARFSKITLEDRNLPVIAEKRVLRPKSETAKQLLDDAFQQTEKIREEVMNVLLTSQADRQIFRKVYPFSPALIETLVAVSSLLQRERTALKVMMQLLVEQKDRLQLGEIIPVGDLFDVISEGDEAFSDVMKKRFDDAKKLYETKLKPLLESESGISFADLAALGDDETAKRLRNDDRLIKTLLLSALADNVESLRNLNASKLAALNHGTVKSPIPGGETQTVLRKVRGWASRIGEIKIGEDPAQNPPISLQITGIDTESIIKQVQTEDNTGNRRRKIRELLLEQFGVSQSDNLFQTYDFGWRATKRDCEIVFGNIRDENELPESSFATDGDRWRVIIDFPFDDAGRSPKDDISRLQKIKQQSASGNSLVLCWIPSFFSLQIQKDLGTLVALDYILTGERFGDYVAHLAPAMRGTAKTLLENQQRQLKQKLLNCLEICYGIANPQPGMIDPAHSLDGADFFQTLANGLTLKIPSAANFKEAFDNLLAQALEFQFPAHPPFEAEAKLNSPTLTRVYEIVEQAAQDVDGRITVEKPLRNELKLIAPPLKIGEVFEQHFLLNRYWVNHFNRAESEFRQIEGNQKLAVTVGRLRRWIDADAPAGLPKEIQNLIIMSFAAAANRTFAAHGNFIAPSVSNLSDFWELREQSLPNLDSWQTALTRAEAIFNVMVAPALNAGNVAKLAGELKRAATRESENKNLSAVLQKKAHQILGDDATFPRLETARLTENLLLKLNEIDGKELVEVFAAADLGATYLPAVKNSFAKASEITVRLEFFNVDLFLGVKKLTDERRAAAEIIERKLTAAIRADEYVTALIPILQEVERDATKLLTEARPTPATVSPAATKPAPEISPLIAAPNNGDTGQIVQTGTKTNVRLAELPALIEEIRQNIGDEENAKISLTWEVRRS